MAFTPLQPASITRYFTGNVSTCYWAPAISNQAAPTSAEMNAATELTSVWAEWGGFSTSTDMVDMPGLATSFVSQIGGRVKPEASYITFYQDKFGVDLRTLLVKDTIGYIVIADGGVAGGKCSVFKVQVAAVVPIRDAEAPGKYKVDFAILAPPSENVSLP
jgi:hypothetical protein